MEDTTTNMVSLAVRHVVMEDTDMGTVVLLQVIVFYVPKVTIIAKWHKVCVTTANIVLAVH